ncbi:MAG: hypothetical protein ACHQIK_18540 [Candidatus Acidiferrales bacterium]
MPLPINTSEKAGIIARAKALGVLSLPFIAFAAVVFLASSLQSRLGTPRESQVAQPSGDGPMSVVVEKESAPQVSGSTSVKTYIVTGTY